MDSLHSAAPAALVPTYGGRAARDHYTQHGLSAQYELGVERQLTLDGRAEPVRGRERPEPVDPVVDDATGDLFDGSVGSSPGRPEAAVQRPCNNVPPEAPLGDPSALPERSGIAGKYRLVRRVQGHAMGLANGPLLDAAMATLKVLRGCGVAVPPGEGKVRFRAKRKGKASATGLIRCGRWCCPDCGPFAARRRRESLSEQAPAVAGAGLHFHFVPTIRHRKGAKYAELREVLAAIWRRMTQRPAWKGVIAHVRADEVTYGKHGWHLHKHILLTLPHGADVAEFKAWVQGLWEREARKHGRTCDWTHSNGWWSDVAPEAVETTAAYLQKLSDEPPKPVSADRLMSVAGGEVIAQASKPGSRPWDLEPAQYVELFVGSKGQRTFGLGGLWRTAKTVAVEADEDAAALRETDDPEFASVSYDDVRELRLARFETMTWLTGSLRNEALRSEWLIRLESVFGFALTVVRDPSAMTDDDGGCGGDAPTVAQGAESGGAEADVAPVPGITNSVDEAPESIWTVFRSTPPVRVASAQTADTGFPLPSVSVVGSVAESVEGRFSSQPLPIGASPLHPVPFAPDFPLMRGEKRSGGITWP